MGQYCLSQPWMGGWGLWDFFKPGFYWPIHYSLKRPDIGGPLPTLGCLSGEEVCTCEQLAQGGGRAEDPFCSREAGPTITSSPALIW